MFSFSNIYICIEDLVCLKMKWKFDEEISSKILFFNASAYHQSSLERYTCIYTRMHTCICIYRGNFIDVNKGAFYGQKSCVNTECSKKGFPLLSV
jgi:hypothetical protein